MQARAVFCRPARPSGRLTERLEERTGEERALARLFVLEIDKDVGAVPGARADDAGPARQILGRIALIAQPKVPVRGGDLDRGAELLAVRHTECDVRGPQP